MSMLETQKRLWQLTWALIIVLVFCWIEYDSRLRCQDRLEKEIEKLEYQCSKNNTELGQLHYMHYEKLKIMPSCLIQEPAWTRKH